MALELVAESKSLIFALGRVVMQSKIGTFSGELSSTLSSEVLSTASDESDFALKRHGEKSSPSCGKTCR